MAAMLALFWVQKCQNSVRLGLGATANIPAKSDCMNLQVLTWYFHTTVLYFPLESTLTSTLLTQ